MERNLHAEGGGRCACLFSRDGDDGCGEFVSLILWIKPEEKRDFSSLICASRTLNRQHNGEASCTIT
jgi:hypothetical protein